MTTGNLIVDEILAYNRYFIEEDFIKYSEFTRTGKRIIPKGLVIHWTANIGSGASAKANRNFFNNRTGTYGSAHLVGDSSEILAALPYMPNNAEQGYHVGAKKYYTTQFGTHPNDGSIGYEMCVNKDGNFRESYKRAVWTMAYLCKIYKFNPSTDILRHWDITRKDCPLPMLDLIFDDNHFASKGWSVSDREWIQNNLKIDGVQGEKLWTKFKSDISLLMKYIDSNGKSTMKVEAIKVEQWKLDTLKKLASYKQVSGEPMVDYDTWKNKLNDNVPAWLMFELMKRILEKVEK
jgi:N-acetylmuramoyl-L-alanine amidase CwlA